MIEKKSLFICLILFTVGSVFADDSKFSLFGFDIDIDGKLRVRTAYLDEFYPEDLYTMGDAKAKLSIDISNESLFYVNSLFEIGNIEFGDNFEIEDLSDLEVKELYIGLDSELLDSKIGIIDVNTPGDYVYSDENAGLQVKYQFNDFDFKAFYSMTNLIADDLEIVEDQTDINHLLYAGIQRDTSYKYDIWAMFLDDNSQDDYDYFSAWIGWEGEKELDGFNSNFGFTYNFGKITEDETEYDLSAYYAHGMVEFETTETLSVFGRLNLTSGDNEMTDAVNQFQSPDGQGSLDTSLGLLFGGSPYSSISYFSNESLSIYSENLSDGNITLSDPGLIVYEAGVTFKPENIPFESQFVIGGVSTSNADSISDSSFLGVEFDLHNQYKFNEFFSIALSFAYFMPGDGLTYVYYVNEDEILDDDNTYKIDCSFTMKF